MPSITNPGLIVLPIDLSISFCGPENGIGEVRACRVGAGEICVGQIRTRQIRIAQIGSREIST
jgi:hypothetical protein